MSNVKTILEEKLAQLEKGLFFMSKDRARALSNHETEDLIDELRAAVTEMQTQVTTL